MNIAISGTVVDIPDRYHMRVRENHAFMIDKSGFISWTGHKSDLPRGVEIQDYGDALILPGLVDSHVHLTQYPFAGVGQGKLLEWLNEYTFPTEAHFLKPDFARRVARQFFSDLLRRGTTTAAIYVTSNPLATDIAFEEAMRSGIRVQMGQVHMDQFAPKELLLDQRSGMEAMDLLFHKWHNRQGRLFYSVIPRFALAVSSSYMEQLGKFAKRHKLSVQTHIAENLEEVKEVKRMFAKSEHYADVYRQAELLGPKTLLAHGIYLTDEEVELIAESGSHVVHCASSNRYLASGIYPFRRRSQQGIKNLLGSDVGAGYSLNMMAEIREALETDKTLGLVSDLVDLALIQSMSLASRSEDNQTASENNLSSNASVMDPSIRNETFENATLKVSDFKKESRSHQVLQEKNSTNLSTNDHLLISELFYSVTRYPHKIFHDNLLGLFEESAPADFIVMDDSIVNPWKDLGFFQDNTSRMRRVIYSDEIVVKETWIQGQCLYRKSI